MSYATLVRKDLIPQSEPLDARQVKNNAGGFVYELDIWGRLHRFLILGSDAQTYYQSARDLTRENAAVIDQCWSVDYGRTAQAIADISVAGRAPKNSPAIFALAMGTLSENVDARRAALAAVDQVCRTASHLFEFASILDALGRGFGRSVQRTFQNWYESRPVDKLGYQMSKYRDRFDYSHERLIKRSRPKAADGDAQRVALYRWAIGRDHDAGALPDVVVGHLAAMKAENASELIPLIEKYRLTWEAVPTWALKDEKVWEALLPNLGLTALLRNLSTLTSVGVIKPLGKHNAFIEDRLTDARQIKEARVHPYAILQGLTAYGMGKAIKGDRTWSPVSTIKDALDDAFYRAFDNVVPTGKRHLLALDVSGSMASAMIGGIVSARAASAAMSLVTARTERQHHFVGFTGGITPLDITAKMSLRDVTRKISNLPFQSTDCAQPMLYALNKGLEVDAFVIYTDNDTWAGKIHPMEALKRYRKETGINAKLVVAGMTSTGFSIADPKDTGSLDIVGFDSSAVSIMGDFIRS